MSGTPRLPSMCERTGAVARLRGFDDSMCVGVLPGAGRALA